MSQLAWMWSLIPTSILYWVINLICIVGLIGLLAGTIGRYIPWFSIYGRIIKPIGVLLLILGVWMRGGYDTELAWRAKVDDLESRIKISEEKSAKENVKIQTVYRDRVQVVRDEQVVIQERIKEVEKIIDAECKIDRAAIDILNSSAKEPKGKAK